MAGKPKIVIVEDELELRETLVDLLSLFDYDVKTAENGIAGYNVIVRWKPDIVLSDIMMPKSDGYELLQKLKTNPDTELIPVLFLTAKVGMEHKLKGLEFGADDYLLKPFHKDELLIKIKNIIQTRKQLLKVMYSTPDKVVSESSDEKFLKNLKLAIEKEISNENYSLADIARDMNYSSSAIQKKVKAITNQSVSEFVRHYRLKRSHDLILVGFGSLSQIADKVGFRSLSYFSTSYKNYFGESPSEAMAKAAL